MFINFLNLRFGIWCIISTTHANKFNFLSECTIRDLMHFSKCILDDFDKTKNLGGTILFFVIVQNCQVTICLIQFLRLMDQKLNYNKMNLMRSLQNFRAVFIILQALAFIIVQHCLFLILRFQILRLKQKISSKNLKYSDIC